MVQYADRGSGHDGNGGPVELNPRVAARALGPALVIVAIQVVAFPMPVGAVLSGVILGLLGALGAIGLALIWRANRVINFAQGDLGAFPATLAVLLITVAGLPWLLGLTIGLAAAVAVGLLADILVIRRFFKAPRLLMTVATIGLAQVLAFCSLLLPGGLGGGPGHPHPAAAVRVQPLHRRRGVRRQRPHRGDRGPPAARWPSGSCCA